MNSQLCKHTTLIADLVKVVESYIATDFQDFLDIKHGIDGNILRTIRDNYFRVPMKIKYFLNPKLIPRKSKSNLVKIFLGSYARKLFQDDEQTLTRVIKGIRLLNQEFKDDRPAFSVIFWSTKFTINQKLFDYIVYGMREKIGN